MTDKTAIVVDSTIGKLSVDAVGSPVAGVRMDPSRAYADVPELLKSFIDESDTSAWEEIKKRIDYIYSSLDHALSRLNEETAFGEQVKSRIQEGKKLLFKPNMVNPRVIDPATHGEGLGNCACTPWPFIAALMRWFHDKLDITYHEMAVGEAASATSIMAGAFGLLNTGGGPITTEAVIEGKSGDFYGGWGFYFVRKYLSETHQTSHQDDPMNGYEESVSGRYLPPGRAGGRLMVYDLNRLCDNKSKPREVPVPDGANFKEITLHKAIVGGDPGSPEDIKDYPGCVLINVPKLKMHAIDLLTNAIKNLGIGLYPMEVAHHDDPESTQWKYAFPFKSYPGMKTEIPHSVWVAKADDETGLPIRDENGNYIVTKTAGMSGTQADVIKATENQGVLMLHVVDAIEPTNIDHTGGARGVKVPEGYVLASLDPVALDLVCARYCFKMVPMLEARRLQKEQNLSTDFIQKVPIPKSDGQNIVTEDGFDSPLFRYNLFKYAEDRGLGQQSYYIVGWDSVAGAPLASLEGHLGRVEDGRFSELITPNFYFNPATLLWDLQRTVLGYLEANDSLTGSSYYQEVLDAFDEDGDGVIDYDEHDKNGFWTPLLRLGADAMRQMAVGTDGLLRTQFLYGAMQVKYGDGNWNAQGHDFMKAFRLVFTSAIAFMMSQVETESQDPFFPNVTWGKGKWPSLQLAIYVSAGSAIYGPGFPMAVDLMSLYGLAFQYADRVLNRAGYTGGTGAESDPAALSNYIKAVSEGCAPLDFMLYVPQGYGKIGGNDVPNVEETTAPEKILTVHFDGGREVW